MTGEEAITIGSCCEPLSGDPERSTEEFRDEEVEDKASFEVERDVRESANEDGPGGELGGGESSVISIILSFARARAVSPSFSENGDSGDI